MVQVGLTDWDFSLKLPKFKNEHDAGLKIGRGCPAFFLRCTRKCSYQFVGHDAAGN